MYVCTVHAAPSDTCITTERSTPEKVIIVLSVLYSEVKSFPERALSC